MSLNGLNLGCCYSQPKSFSQTVFDPKLFDTEYFYAIFSLFRSNTALPVATLFLCSLHESFTKAVSAYLNADDIVLIDETSKGVSQNREQW